MKYLLKITDWRIEPGNPEVMQSIDAKGELFIGK
jgi:hypothetical protein